MTAINVDLWLQEPRRCWQCGHALRLERKTIEDAAARAGGEGGG